jgi:hypothetical protein
MRHRRRELTRRQFTGAAALAFLGGATITISSGCGGGGSNPGGPTPGAGDRLGVVSANHGHVAFVNAVQLQAGNGVTLDIRGEADHTHSVGLTGDEVVMIRDGGRVRKESSFNDIHTHTVTFN